MSSHLKQEIGTSGTKNKFFSKVMGIGGREGSGGVAVVSHSGIGGGSMTYLSCANINVLPI
jgi:hypothetical protein